jgi:hypothetical protein
MASESLRQAVILVGGLAVESNTNQFAMEPQLRVNPATTFGSGGFAEVRPGLLSASLALQGYTDFASGAIAEYLGVVPASEYVVTVATPGTTAGDVSWLMRVRPTDLQTVGGEVGVMAPFMLNASGNAPFGRGSLLHPVTTRSANGNGTAVALAGPTASQSLYVALHVTATTGGGTWTVKVQSDDSSGMSSATDRVTFATFTAQGWQWSSVAGAFDTETHLRATWSVTGGTTPTATFAVSCFVV